MTLSLLWYVLAGVLLGFAASTLWEWLYFRNKRVKFESSRIQELEAQLADEQALNAQLRLARAPAASQAQTDYASPGVFLDSESEPEQSEEALEAVTVGPSGARSGADPISDVSELASENSDRASHFAYSDPETGVDGGSVAAAGVVATVDSRYADRESSLVAEASSGDEAAARADRSNDTYVDALATQPDDEDDATTLERLAAELASRPVATSTTAARPSKTSSARSPEHPDNLSMIKGIGDVYKFRLYAAGIFTWHQVAESDIESLRAATHAYPGSNVEEWGPQAQKLAEKHGREGAHYTGPVPDDLTKIIGIGPVGERTLYRAGICTFGQLARATISELKELFPVAIAGDEPDFTQWIRLARDLADRRDIE